ncbi:SDR family NAD(P)-dependent oxidoreductase [Neochlamydia sp. EPS4]|uniref:SDR family NAD(P)-dependent oxidoreductase n=1 Tax=Neochlamydia sp. EPS4 TaxID=1478175 RepID=UPI0005D10C41|nr:SDR family NAD(P)-dependent oxidoreductase [Neochlamydia sp. EPS4]
MKQDFKNQTVMITGASSGFGAAFAEAFAREGASLINIARRKDRLQALESSLQEKYGVEILSIELDVSDEKAVVEKLGLLAKDSIVPDLLINNAGMVRGLNKVWETPPQDWNEMIDINIKGLLNVSAQIIPHMVKKNAGHIINVGSISSHDTYPGGGIYCATKFAVKAITDTLRKELVNTPIRVSMISPGMAETEFSLVRFAGDKDKANAVYENIQPLTAEDVAEIVLFMATRPPHVNLADVVVYPTHQASVSLVYRGEGKAKS